MKNIENPWIKLKENINKEDYEVINRLQQECIDKVALKLELDYKLASSNESSKITNNTNEFMYFDGEKLIGYIGIGSFGGFNNLLRLMEWYIQITENKVFLRS